MSEVDTEALGRFILASPPGEESDVIKALATATNADISEAQSQYLQQYNKEQYLIADIPGTSDKTLITSYGEISPEQFIDPNGQRLITFNHISQKVTEFRDLSTEELAAHEGIRKSIQGAVEGYVKQHYKEGVSAVYASEAAGGKQAVVVVINATKVNPGSMWGSRWRSSWIIVLDEGSKATLTGSCDVAVHFFENGNVHLKSTDPQIELTVPWNSDQASFSKAIIQKILEKESFFESGISESFLLLQKSFYTSLRKKLPTNKVKINWELISFQGMVKK